VPEGERTKISSSEGGPSGIGEITSFTTRRKGELSIGKERTRTGISIAVGGEPFRFAVKRKASLTRGEERPEGYSCRRNKVAIGGGTCS